MQLLVTKSSSGNISVRQHQLQFLNGKLSQSVSVPISRYLMGALCTWSTSIPEVIIEIKRSAPKLPIFGRQVHLLLKEHGQLSGPARWSALQTRSWLCRAYVFLISTRCIACADTIKKNIKKNLLFINYPHTLNSYHSLHRNIFKDNWIKNTHSIEIKQLDYHQIFTFSS